jgi:hypothetical protein
MALAEVIEDIELSYKQFEFAIRLLTYCEVGNLDAKKFDDDHVIDLPEGTFHFPAGRFSDVASITNGAAIGVLLSVGGMAIALDRGFDEKKFPRDPAANDPAGKLRLLIYMVRSAFAHDIASPCWEVRGAFQRRLTIDFDPNPLTIDLTALHGQAFHMNQLGGYYNWVRIYENALDLLKT